MRGRGRCRGRGAQSAHRIVHYVFLSRLSSAKSVDRDRPNTGGGIGIASSIGESVLSLDEQHSIADRLSTRSNDSKHP